MATITAQAATTNAALAYTAAAGGGDTIAAGSAQRTTLLVKNASAATITLTIAAVNVCSQGFLHNVIVSCLVGDTEVALPTNCATAAGNYGITYSAVTSLTIAAINT